jgi:outer membrane protein insertion porin family
MSTFRNSIAFLLICFMTACSTTKHLPEGEQLYTGATVKLIDSGTTARQHKIFKSDLQAMVRPKPNTRFLGIPIKLGIYNMFRKSKPNSFFGRFRDKNGEPPVLVSSLDVENNVKLLRGHLENKGFFKAGVTGDTIVKGKKGHAEFIAKAGAQYKINTVSFPNDSNDLANAIQLSAAHSFLKPNEPYDLDVIRGERNRIDAFVKERGFYFFSPDHLILRVDSTIGKNRVDMRVAIKDNAPDDAVVPYTINDVVIYANYNINSPRLDTSMENAQFYKDYYVVDRRKRFKPRMFDNVMQFNAGELYNRTDHNQTLNRLISLNEFKFVRNRFEPVPDSAKLNAYYYLTPMPKKSLRAEFNVTSKSNDLSGSAVQFRWLNRNMFRGGEQVSLSAYIGTEVQLGGKTVDEKGEKQKRYPTYRSGAELTFAFPRFIIPIFNINPKGNYVPRTNIRLGYDLLNRKELYTVNSFRFDFGYVWKPSLEKTHELFPININYVQPLKVSQEYRDSIAKYPYLNQIIDSQFVLGTVYQFSYNQLATGLQKRNAFFVLGLADFSGNIAGLITGADAQAGNQKRIFNAKFDQYIKLEVDGRYYRRLGLNSSWVNRIDIGYGHPHGNSLILPYVKQFFSGGNNSIRAFRSRSLGPGTFKEVNSTNTNFFANQTGDIKLEFNTEFRPHISGPLYGALFIDAGNIWLFNEDTTRPGGKFTSDFMKQLAVGAGVGLRFDIQLFVIRLDVGVPLRKPWEQNPWVMNQIDFFEPAWRKENIIYNLAIGYPF